MVSPRVRCSTTYTAMMKIIAIITTVGHPPSQSIVVTDPEEQRSNCKRGLDIDLNLRLGPWPDDEIGSGDGGGGGATGCSGIVDVSDAPAESSVMSSSVKKPPSAVGSISGEGLTADKSSQGECNPEGRTKMKKAEEVGREYSEITNIQAEEGGKRRRSEGYLDVLVEAVRQVSGFFSDEEEEEEEDEEEEEEKEEEARAEEEAAAAAESRKKRGLDLEEECGPVVRSKRGRNQALPSRYRDSVLEPWGKLPTVTRCSKAARR
ncbi:Histone-lysine N-methyltransferase protein [Dioscorea alata]|uniref:Histone-lysine N-methyltransferase protein n=1 Tax=Dioscorea alata TaxID=55571 RepID=A0ACB7VYR4_DIOAL|nr:Histone-lysine N-methyltransferase protein [Dioscorea alata]